MCQAGGSHSSYLGWKYMHRQGLACGTDSMAHTLGTAGGGNVLKVYRRETTCRQTP